MNAALLAVLARLVILRPAIGMKLDISNGRKPGLCLAACRVAVMVASMAGFVAGSQANDSLAGLADPTQPPYRGTSGGIAVSKPTGPMLQSTFISTSQRRAVINGKSYTVGDKFGGAVIADIQPYEVVLKQAGRETRLRLLPKLAKELNFVKAPADSQEGGNEK
jgi:hypothetical protein